jgi:uncharacterized membrane protein (GlpM family)
VQAQRVRLLNRREKLASATGTLSVVLAFVLAATHNTSTAGLLALFGAFAASVVASFMMK